MSFYLNFFLCSHILSELLQFSDSYCLHVTSFPILPACLSFSCRWPIGRYCFFKSSLAICLFNGVFYNSFLFNAIFEMVGFHLPFTFHCLYMSCHFFPSVFLILPFVFSFYHLKCLIFKNYIFLSVYSRDYSVHLSLSQPTSDVILIILQYSSISSCVLCAVIIIVCRGQFLDYLVF